MAQTDFKPGDIVRSVNTGFIVRVTSVDSDKRYFTGTQIGNALMPYMPERFHWHGVCWVACNFVPFRLDQHTA